MITRLVKGGRALASGLASHPAISFWRACVGGAVRFQGGGGAATRRRATRRAGSASARPLCAT